jgi:colanic acid/amylovoran biosynthesis protein
MKRGGPRILIVNAHSQANAGDFAIVLGQLQLLNKLLPDARVIITSRTARSDRRTMASRGVRVIDPLFHAPCAAGGKWMPWARTLFSLALPLPALVFLRHLIQADLVMACGGGYFYSNRRFPGFTYWQNILQLRLAVLFRKQVVFFPQSFGPFANSYSRRLLASLLASEHVRHVFAREPISLSVLGALLPAAAAKGKLRFCPDMAFYYSPGFISAQDRIPGPSRPRLALALRDWDFPGCKTRFAKKEKRDDYLDGVLVTCRTLHQQLGACISIFSQAQGPSLAEDDRHMSALIHDRLRDSIPATDLRFFASPDGAAPDAFIGLLGQSDLLITSRLHAAIFAFLAGIPAVVIGYQHKSLGVLQSLGLESCYLSIEEMQGPSLLHMCEGVLQDPDAWRQKIARSLSELRGIIETQIQSALIDLGVRA